METHRAAPLSAALHFDFAVKEVRKRAAETMSVAAPYDAHCELPVAADDSGASDTMTSATVADVCSGGPVCEHGLKKPGLVREKAAKAAADSERVVL
jgi:hypothetical protein